MLVVLDTNVVVSSFLANAKGYDHSPSHQVLNKVIAGELETCVCAEILAEYRDVLLRPQFNLKVQEVEAFLVDFAHLAYFVSPVASSISLPDESDRVFLDTASTANAILVTGNLKHYPNCPNAKTPAEFLAYSANG
jgi:putative PIN family toxin of toxin-antitoxin system